MQTVSTIDHLGKLPDWYQAFLTSPTGLLVGFILGLLVCGAVVGVFKGK